ncbi:MAG: hypothetical protein WBM75_11355, partial [Polyangiales bacterium]
AIKAGRRVAAHGHRAQGGGPAPDALQVRVAGSRAPGRRLNLRIAAARARGATVDAAGTNAAPAAEAAEAAGAAIEVAAAGAAVAAAASGMGLVPPPD